MYADTDLCRGRDGIGGGAAALDTGGPPDAGRWRLHAGVAGRVGLEPRTGMSHGYTLAQEPPIHLVLFGVPAALAWGLWWWGRQG